MNILINCSNLKIGGGLQVAHSFVSTIKDFPEHSFVVVASSELAKQIDLNLFSKNSKIVTYSIAAKPIKTITGKNDFLDKIVSENNIQVVFSVFGPTYWKPKVKHIVGYAKPHYVYTDSPFFIKLSLISKLKLNIKKFFHMYDFKHNNQILITENKDVSQRLQEILKDKEIHTVTNYYNQLFDQKEKWDDSLQLSNFKGFTMLTISANYPHKNLQIVPQVVSYLNKNYKDFKYRFVVTLERGELGANFGEDINKNIFYLGKVNINQCPTLYSQSDATFLPTLLECFTATYPESMRMNKPILTSNLNFARGLCGDAAVYFNPLDAKNIGDTIYQLASDETQKEIIIENGIKQLEQYDTYASRAEKYIEIITQ